MQTKSIQYLFNASYVAVLVSQLCLGSIYARGFPLRSYMISVCFLLYLLFHFLQKRLFFSLLDRRIFWIFAGFTACALGSWSFSGLIYKTPMPFVNFVFYLFKFLLQSAMVFLITRLFIRLVTPLIFLRVVVFIGALSGIVAFFQFLGVTEFWGIKYILTSELSGYLREFIFSHDDPGRAVGLSLYFISLSYEMLLTFPLAFILFSQEKRFLKILSGLGLLCVLAGLFASKTISAYLGIGAFIAYLLWRAHRRLFYGVVLCGAVIITLCSSSLSSIAATLSARVGFWKAALLTLAHYPAGLPFLRSYGDLSSRFYGASADIVGSSPHNQFLNTFISYGIISSIPYLLFLMILFPSPEYRRLCPWMIGGTGRRPTRVLPVGAPVKRRTNRVILMYGLMVAYFTHSFFHNLGPFFNDVFFWVILGYYCVVVEEDEAIH